MLDRIRGAFGPAELISAGGVICVAIGIGLVSVPAAFVTVGVIAMFVGWRWHEDEPATPVAEEPPEPTAVMPGFNGASTVASNA